MQLRASLALLVFGACNGDPAPKVDAAADAPLDAVADAPGPDTPRFCDTEDRDDDYVAGMSKVGANGYRFTLVSSTPPPARKGVYTWSVAVLDPASQPFDAATFTVVPLMPDHGHGTGPVTVTATGGGGYTLSGMDLFMTGYWTIRLGVRDAGSTELDFARFAFCVD